MDQLGKIGNMHFIDLNKEKMPHELVYTTNVKRTDEALRRIE